MSVLVPVWACLALARVESDAVVAVAVVVLVVLAMGLMSQHVVKVLYQVVPPEVALVNPNYLVVSQMTQVLN